MPYVKISDQVIFYAARGESGAPLVFLHGAGDSHLLWNGQLAACADVARTIALDLPGHGRSTGNTRATIAEYAVAVREFLDGLELECVSLAGHSMGGAIAQTLALEFPDRVRDLILVGTGAKLGVSPRFLSGLETDFENAARLLVENYFAPGASEILKQKSLQQLFKSGSAITRNDFAACDAFDIRERIAQISAPTLILCGCDDKMTPPKYSEFLAQHIPSAQLVILENAGHMVMLEQPDQFDAALRKWILLRLSA